MGCAGPSSLREPAKWRGLGELFAGQAGVNHSGCARLEHIAIRAADEWQSRHRLRAEKALGLISASGTDGWVGIASDATLSQQLGASWSYSPTAVPGSNQYYIVGALEHEIAEVMGRLSYLNVRGEYGVMDLYRYRAPDVRQAGIGSPACFSLDRGNSNLDSWNTLSGGDLGDWASSVGADAFLAFSPSGQINGLTPTDITLMRAIGYGANPAPPAGVPSSVPFDLSWDVVAASDFDGNGKADLAWERSSDNLVEIQLFNGSTPSGGSTIAGSPFDANWQVVASGDFNGDGRFDLIYRRLSDGFTEIQLLNGNKGVGGGAIRNNPFDSAWQIAAAGDFNGNGNSDLAWRRSSDGLRSAISEWQQFDGWRDRRQQPVRSAGTSSRRATSTATARPIWCGAAVRTGWWRSNT